MNEASPEPERRFIYGTLALLARKTGKTIRTYPIDSPHVTIGRDYFCDIRIYEPDISKHHVTIDFDHETGSAALEVTGSNGIAYAPADRDRTAHTPAGSRQFTTHKPPTILPLSDGDEFFVRQKRLRFNYGSQEEAKLEYQSPIVQKVQPRTSVAPGATPRRRNTLRLSIVPKGKRFFPTPVKQRSLDLNGATPAKEPNQDSADFEKLIAIESGDGEEKIYVEEQDASDKDEGIDSERSEGENKPLQSSFPSQAQSICDNPFMTPQLSGKVAASRNTSVIPHTRLLSPPRSPAPINGAQEEEVDDEGFINPAANPVEPLVVAEAEDLTSSPARKYLKAATVPLPSAFMALNDSVSESSTRDPFVPARVAYSTPRGPESLRKALLLRSARKVWEAERLKSVDGSIDAGHIEVRRRKSSIGVAGTPRKSLPLNPPSDSSSGSEDEGYQEDDDEEQSTDNPPVLQWIYEDGQVNVSGCLSDSDSDRESLDMDLSIPGQAIIDFSPEPEEELSDSDAEEEAGYDEDEEDLLVVKRGDNDPSVTEEDGHNFEVEVGEEEPVDERADKNGTAETLEVDPASIPLPATSVCTLPNRFYTPQVSRTSAFRARLSLGTGTALGESKSVTPFASHRALASKAVRPQRVDVDVQVSDDEDAEPLEEPVTPPRAKVPSTPRKTPRGLTPAQREQLATPRRLPSPPASFREPVRGAPSLPATPHRALLSPPSAPTATGAGPSTPMDDLKHRLTALRFKTASGGKKKTKGGRRATVGFSLSGTPSRSAPSTPSRHVPNTAGPSRRYTPAVHVERIEEGESESLPPTPTATPTTVKVSGVSPTREEQGYDSAEENRGEPSEASSAGGKEPVGEEEVQLLSEVVCSSIPVHRRSRHSIANHSDASAPDMIHQPEVPVTPAMDNTHSHLKKSTKKQFTTPYMGDIRALFKEEMKTPSFVGVKEMLQEPRAPPKTPATDGIRALFGQVHQLKTPAVDGIAEMFEELEEVAPENGEESGLEEIAEEEAVEEAVEETVEVENLRTRPEGVQEARIAAQQAIVNRASSDIPIPRTRLVGPEPTTTAPTATSGTRAASSTGSRSIPARRADSARAPVTSERESGHTHSTRSESPDFAVQSKTRGSTTVLTNEDAGEETAARTTQRSVSAPAAARTTRARARTAEPEQEVAPAAPPVPRRSRRVLGVSAGQGAEEADSTPSAVPKAATRRAAIATRAPFTAAAKPRTRTAAATAKSEAPTIEIVAASRVRGKENSGDAEKGDATQTAASAPTRKTRPIRSAGTRTVSAPTRSIKGKEVEKKDVAVAGTVAAGPARATRAKRANARTK